MQIPSLKARGFLFGIRFEPGHPGVKRIGRLMVPSLLGLSVTQINLTISTILASFIAGAPTYLFYGMRLIQFPLGIFGVALPWPFCRRSRPRRPAVPWRNSGRRSDSDCA